MELAGCAPPEIGECTCMCHDPLTAMLSNHVSPCCDMTGVTRIEQAEGEKIYRAGGDVICSDCGKHYYRHQTCVVAWPLAAEDYCVVRRLCNGDLVKL